GAGCDSGSAAHVARAAPGASAARVAGASSRGGGVPRARRRAVAALALLAALAPAPAHALKVTTWNLLQYPGLNLAGRQPKFRTVMQNLDTDISMVQERG